MAESVTFNNATYIIPDVGESNWGQNLTNFFVAIPQGCYQLSGGTAPLTADLSFGTNFGLFAKYLTSVTANPSTAGVVRLANTDAIEWRNHANGANLALSVDTSNNLLWNGDIIATSSTSPVLSITGTAHQVIASAATGNITLSAPQNIDTTSTPTFASETLTATTNQLVLGTTNVITLSSTAPASSQTYTIPDAGGAANVVLDHGNYTIAGTWTFSNGVTISATTNQLVLGTTHTTTISSTAPSASRTYTIPDAGAAANVVLDHGNYTIAGTWSFSQSITLASSKAVILTDNSTNTVTIKATNSTTSWTMSLPTTSGSNNFFLQTDGSGNCTWAAGGAGTVSSGTAGQLAYYASSGSTVSGLSATANGVNAAGYIKGTLIQQVVFSTTTTKNISSSTLTVTNMTQAFTPLSATSIVRVTANFVVSIPSTSTSKCYATIQRGATNLMGSKGGSEANFGSAVNDALVPMFLTFDDTPNTTSSVTYAVYGSSSDNSSGMVFGDANVTQYLRIEEIAQ